MVQNPPADMARVNSGVYYLYVDAAIDWLEKTFGFETRLKIPGEDGKTVHAELTIEGGVIMVGPACPDEKKTSPKMLDGAKTQGVYIYVDDVDAHHERAQSAGAVIFSELEDMFYGDRVYTASDPEGHQWKFGTHVRDVPLEEMPFPAVEE